MADSPNPYREKAAFLKSHGLKFDTIEATRVSAWMELGPHHHQPTGIVHGGVFATAIESAAGLGASEAAKEHGMVAVGLSNTTNFLRAMTLGKVAVEATPIQQGKSQQLWEVNITDDDGRLVANGQVRLQNVAPRKDPKP